MKVNSPWAAPRALLGVGEEVGEELFEEKKYSDLSELSGVPTDPCEVEESNRPTALRVKLDVASLMTRNQGGNLACTDTVKQAIFDFVIGRSESMMSWSNEN